MTTPPAPAPERDGPTGLRRWAFLARPGWLAMIAAVLGFAAACFLILAPWQFGRNAERSAQNDAVQSAVNASPVPLTDLMSATAEPGSDAIWRPATATGVYEPDRQVYVRLRQDSGGNPVSEVVVPLLLADGNRLLVDRGYVSFTDVQEGVPLPVLPTGTVTITGRVQVDQTDPAKRAAVQVDGRTEVYAINAAAVAPAGIAPAASDSDTFYRGYVQLTDQSPGALIPIGLPQVDSGPFLSYALQWCAFGVIALIGLAVFVFREATGGRPEDDHDWIAGSPSGGDGTVHGGQEDATGRPAEHADPAPTNPPEDTYPRGDRNPPVTAGSSRKRRSRDGFDPSQLYDD